jgi:hypothetical protein
LFHKSFVINTLRDIWSAEAGNPSNRCAEAFVDIYTSMKAKIPATAGVAGLGVLAEANADEMQFITLPKVVREATGRMSITQSLEQHP